MKNKIEYDALGQARSFSGPEAVNVFSMAVLSASLRLYAKAKILPTRGVTAKLLMSSAVRMTGQKFKARDYLGAAEALSAKVQSEKARLAAQEEKS